MRSRLRWYVLFYFLYLFESLKTYKLVWLYFCIAFFNTLIYRYIAIVYVYRYVWKQNKLKKWKPVRKRISFVTLPFFLNLYLSLCPLLLSFSRNIVCSFNCKFVWLILVLLISNILVSLYSSYYVSWLTCYFVYMIFSMFYYPYCCLIFIILLTLWKISWMFEQYVFCEAVYF